MDQSTAAVEFARWSALLTPVLALACNVIAQVVQVRLSRGSHFLRSILIAFLAGFLVFGLLEVWRITGTGVSGDSLAIACLVNAPIYVALSYCYFNFVNLGQTSVRIRLYTEIAERPGGMSASDLVHIYDEKALMRARVDRLLESGDLVERDGRYHLGRRRLVPIASVIFYAKRLVLGRASEFHPAGDGNPPA
jgi:hypothetical protein